MSPALNINDIVISKHKSPKDIKVGEKDGDILILRGARYFYENGIDPIVWNGLKNDVPIIHRAIGKKMIGNKFFFKTKGDNSIAPDGAFRTVRKTKTYMELEYDEKKIVYIPEDEILGVVKKKLPERGENNNIQSVFSSNFLNVESTDKIRIKIYYKKNG